MQNFSLGRRLTFANFEVLWLFAKVFSAKVVFFINLRKFSPSKVSAVRYNLVLMISGWLDQRNSQMRVTGYPTRVSGWTLQNPVVTREKRVGWKVCNLCQCSKLKCTASYTAVSLNVGYRVCIVIHTVDVLHTRLCNFTLSASFLYLFFTLHPQE